VDPPDALGVGLENQEDSMKTAVGLTLALFASIVVADTATARGLNSRPGPQQEPQGQNGFSEVQLKAHGKRARSHHTVVVQLSHPHSAPHPTSPDGTPGRHAIPYEFPRTRVHRFCVQDDDGQRHRMVLTDAEGNHVLSVTGGEECVTATIEAGQYTATLHHDGSGTSSDVNTVFIRGQFEPVDDSVLSSLTGAEPRPSAGPITRAADASAQCHSWNPDFVCCSHLDTWALQASNGFYVTVNNGLNASPGRGPFLSAVRSIDPQGKITGATSPGQYELFEVFTCTLRGGTGPQFPRDTIFLSAPSINFGYGQIGGFVYMSASDENGPRTAGALIPGIGQHDPVVLDDLNHCAQPLHLTKYFGVRQISLSATLAERDWCTGGPLSGGEAFYITENAEHVLSSYDGDPTRPIVEPRDTSFFTPSRDFTILFATGNCSACNLDEANLASHNLAFANLSGASLQKANLAGANLRRASLPNAKLQNATLSFAYMPDADLTGADLTGAHLNNVDFYQVEKRPSLKGATLYQTQFAEANLIGIDLSEAHLEGANFSDARMLGALLTGITHVAGSANGRVSFVKTLLAGANFSSSTFDGGDFANAIFSTRPGTVDLLVRNSPTTTVTQPYGFAATARPLSTTGHTVCPNTTSGPCATDAQWVAQDPPIYQGYNDPDDW
jgi:uncharacterized protein YjbI with pentapeptide repeats